MANYVYLIEATDAPCGLTMTSTGHTGAGPATTNYSFLLVAWDDPEEKDLSRARFVNHTPYFPAPYGSGTGTLTAICKYENLAYVKAGTTNDTVTASWTPPRRAPHHYSFYRQVAGTYTLTTLGNKVKPLSTTLKNGDIPGNATSATLATSAIDFTSVGTISHTYYARVADLDTTNHIAYLMGNHLGTIKAAGGTITEFPSTIARTTSAATLSWGQGSGGGGERTKVTLTAGPTAAQTYFLITGGQFYALSVTPQTSVLLDPTIWLETQARELTVPDLNGRMLKRSILNTAVDDVITIKAPYTGMNIYAPGGAPALDGGALYQLQKWRKDAQLLWLVVVMDTDWVCGPGQWTVTIKDVNEYQLPEISDFEAVQIDLKPESYLPATYDYGYANIVAVTAGAATVGIQGPADPRMVPGARVWIAGSTGNDGLWVILSVTKAANNHVMTMTKNMLDSTADGMVIFGAEQ